MLRVYLAFRPTRLTCLDLLQAMPGIEVDHLRINLNSFQPTRLCQSSHKPARCHNFEHAIPHLKNSAGA
jgi:hypothetical protein